MKEKGTRMCRGRIILVLLLFLLVAALVILFINRNTIKALYKGLTTNSETIGEMLEQNNSATKDALSQSGMEMTDEDFAKINSGELTEEEIAALLYNRLTGEGASSSTDNDNATDVVSSPSEDNSTPENNKTETPPETKNEDLSTPSNENNNGQSGQSGTQQQTSASSKTDVGKTETTEKTPSADKTTQKEPAAKDNKKTDRTDPSNSKDEAKEPKANTPSTSQPNSVAPAATGSNKSSTSVDKSQTSGITGTTKPGTSTQKVSDEEYNRKVSELIAQVYVIKANFTSQLSVFESSIINSYKALPPEQRTAATKARIVSENMGYVVSMEAQCDAQISAVTAELYAFLTSCGKDTSLVDSINSAYANEKELKKAYYISLYK